MRTDFLLFLPRIIFFFFLFKPFPFPQLNKMLHNAKWSEANEKKKQKHMTLNI